MKKIIIIGAGFAGLRTALELQRRLSSSDAAEVTIIDKDLYHVFHGNLYELATSPEELVTLTQLQQSIALPIADIVARKGVTFLHADVTSVNHGKKEIHLGNKKLTYDYLVIALGSAVNDYGIPGVRQYAVSMKSLKDALRIRNRIEFLFQTHRYDMVKDYLRIVVAGGGLSGVEVAAELKGYVAYLAWKNNFPLEKVEILLIEGTNRLLPGLDAAMARDVFNRLQQLGIRVQLHTMVKAVEQYHIQLDNGERLEYDALIWSAGIKAAEVGMEQFMSVDQSKRLLTTACLNSPECTEVFCIGDQASIVNAAGKPVPASAPQALDQAEYVADSILALLRDRKPPPYQCRQFGYSIPLGGKWAILKTKHLYLTGYLGYLARQFIILRYFASLVGWWKALKLLLLQERIYSRNNL